VAASDSDSSGTAKPFAASTSQPSTLHSQPPPPIPDYELLRRIGSGSYGEVWLARNVLGQCRAVKIIYRSRFVDPRPFEREFEGIQRFEPISRSHPSQLHILHVGKNDAAGCFFYVMELADAAEPRVEGRSELRVERHAAAAVPSPGAADEVSAEEQNLPGQGEGGPILHAQPSTQDPLNYTPHTLRHALERHTRLPISDCVQIGLSLATALAHLHEQGLVHRDIKPSNIIFVNGVAKLGDIGLVTDAGDTQSIVGTEGYLPPEGPGTPQADLFSLGKVLYEMSTGMDRRRFAELPDDLREWTDRTAVVEFNEIVLKACAKDPAQRYASADELQADLELLQRGKSVKSFRLYKRRWGVARKAAGMGFLLAAAVGVMVTLLNREKRTDDALGGPPSTNELANALCSKALANLRADNQRSYPEVYTNLHRAIELDPNFARPYVGLLEMHLRENMPGVNYPPKENERTITRRLVGPLWAWRDNAWGQENERTITRRLVELAPDSAAAHCGQFILAYYDWDFPRAERHARRAIQVEPDYELGHTFYGFMLCNWGRTVEARQQLEVSRRLNPSKVQIHRCLADTYYADRNFPRAIEMYREAIGWERTDLYAHLQLGRALRAMGDYQKAVDVFEEMESIQTGEKPQPGSRHDQLRQALARDGVRGYWEEEWRHAPTNRFLSRAEIQARLGNTNAAFELLEQAYQTPERFGPVQEYIMTTLWFREVWDPLREHPRFRQLLDRVGFTKVMPSSGKK